MQRFYRYWKLLNDGNRCILTARRFITCTNGPSSVPYCAVLHVPRSVKCTTRGSFPVVLQCLNLSQASKVTRLRRTIPDELWAILILGKFYFPKISLKMMSIHMYMYDHICTEDTGGSGASRRLPGLPRG